MTLYHFCTPQEWEEKRAAGVYKPDSLHQEGFIHLSTKQQLPKTYERYFGALENVLLLRITLQEDDTALRFEDLYDRKEAFPHYYAPLPVDAVDDCIPVPRPTMGGSPDYEQVLHTFFEQL